MSVFESTGERAVNAMNASDGYAELQERYEVLLQRHIMAAEKLQSIVEAVQSDDAFEEAMHSNPLVVAIASIAVKRYLRRLFEGN
jgi:hypothetical protein